MLKTNLTSRKHLQKNANEAAVLTSSTMSNASSCHSRQSSSSKFDNKKMPTPTEITIGDADDKVFDE